MAALVTTIDMMGRFCNTSAMLFEPERRMSSRVITCTGKAVFCSLRTMDEPVISTLSNCRKGRADSKI